MQEVEPGHPQTDDGRPQGGGTGQGGAFPTGGVGLDGTPDGCGSYRT